ncbi:MAG TPA: ABC transporter ATP-binding protein [Vicinamibacterales bacterium]|jgi:nitrate/nitrite transport system ATP-binding protein|nr:ABC transporter ATP-binding protein [Vicinamibacterales bacterium]
MPFIEVTGLSKSFPAKGGSRHVLQNVALTVERGEFVAIVGAMGSGKSTLLSMLAGLTSPDAGTIQIDGQPLNGIRHDAAFVFQNYSLLPWLTALENVRLAVGAAFPNLSKAEQQDRARATLEKVGLGNAVSRRPRQLSGGMRQRVAIARALATDPQVMFLDEPLGALDALTRESLQGELARLCGDGDGRVTTVMITNSVDEAILLADRIVPILPGPPATLGTPIAVTLPRPRTAALLAHDDGAARVRAHVITTLTDAVAGTTRTRKAAAAIAGASARSVRLQDPAAPMATEEA